MKKLIMMALALLTLGAMAGDPRVENVRARQIPDTKDVEVIYDLIAPDGGLFNVSATFRAPGVAPEPKTVTGDFGKGVAPGCNRRFVWDAGVDWPDNVNSNFVCTVSAEEQSNGSGGSGGVQLWEDGPYWAECNVGASKPEECGLYFWWGDTVGHAGDWTFNGDTCPTEDKGIDELREMGYLAKYNDDLVPEYDAATAHLGSPWRMPTEDEFNQLIGNCDSQWTMRNGVAGRLVKGRGAYASKSIFLPAAGVAYGFNGAGDSNGLNYLGSIGCYLSSTALYGYRCDAYLLRFHSSWMFRFNDSVSFGYSVRPVRGGVK